jgi:hypothetical protein
MQVSHTDDHITHAVLSANKAVNFKISESAAFFNILSSTLYTDQVLAVVRETICNAWDAHIDAGITDRPIEITLTPEKLTFRDFGKGIAPDKMGEIYGTYGASTKLNDGEQTGGFGLGCKSPFAYDDHFEVTSHHAGFKTIYRLSKSSAELGGLPTITPILTIPSTETGLQVSLSLKETGHIHSFSRNIKSVVFNGEILAKLNDEILPVLPMSKTAKGYIITDRPLFSGDSTMIRNSRIFIRYGNVVYPVPSHREFNTQFRRVEALMSSVGRGSNSDYSVIFQAPPHSISVTPSREALSMQSHTIDTISKLLENFDPYKGELTRQKFFVALERQIQKTANEKNWPTLLKGEERVPGTKPTERISFSFITNDDEFIEQTIMNQYPNVKGFLERDMLNRLNVLSKNEIIDRGLAHKFRTAMRKLKGIYKKRGISRGFARSWYKREILSPLYRDLMHVGMPTKCLYAILYNHWSHSDYNASNMLPENMWKLMPFLQKRVVLTTNFDATEKRLLTFPGWQHSSERLSCFVYVVSRKKGDIEKAQNFFKERGYEITDLTYRHDWEPEPAKRVITSTPRKPRAKGYVALSAAKLNGRYTENNLIRSDAPRIENPEFYYSFHQSKTITDIKFPGLDYPLPKLIIDLFGDKGAAVYTNAQRTKVMVDDKVPAMREYVLGKVYDKVLEPHFLDYWPTDPGHCADIDTRQIHGGILGRLTFVLNIPEVRTKLGLAGTLSIEDRKYLRIFNEIRHARSYMRTVETVDKRTMTTIEKELVKFPKDPVIQKMIEKVKTDKIFRFVRLDDIPEVLKNIRSTKDQTALDKMVDILVLTLKA